MAAPVLNSISPSSGPPGAALTCTGAGFPPGARVGCPALVDTVRVSDAELQAEIPLGIAGPAGGSMVVAVFIETEGGERSATLPFTVIFPAAKLQTWTEIGAVCGEVPGFKRGGRIADATIEVWMRSAAQAIAAAMLRRGLSLDAADWQQPGTDAMPSPAGVLELINRYGAAMRLASAIGGDVPGEWSLARDLRKDFEQQLKALRDGEYDKLFRPQAATVDADAQAGMGELVDGAGDVERAFSKTKVF